MRIAFIKPNMGRMEHAPYVDEARMEPLQLGVLAGMTPQDVSVSLVEDRCEDIPYDSPVDLVAITVEIFTAKRAYEISAEYRRRGVPVILGGFHPTLLPEEAGLHADSIVIGDAETAWPDIIEDAKNGNLKPVYRPQPGIPQSKIIPRRDIFKGKGYLPLSLVQFGRGCQNACS
ncbi:MAG: cobalamin-dependent protein, partial [Planctomycetota bacterium]